MKSNIDRTQSSEFRELANDEIDHVAGGNLRKELVVPDYRAPKVLYDDGINILTTDPSTSNVAYDSPFTRIPHPA